MKKLFTITMVASVMLVYGQSDMELASQSVHQNTIKSHIGFLASDELEGRDTPSRGLRIAAKYIESRFVEYGVSTVKGMDSFFSQ